MMQEKVKENLTVKTTCRLCSSRNIKKVLPLTPSALCDAYVSQENLGEKQEIYPLDLFLCHTCGYAHLPYVVDPEIIYRDYIYVTTSSMGLADHFKDYTASVLEKVKPAAGSLVVDVGSNDGTLLKFFKAQGMRVLGIEPAVKIAQDATRGGVETLPNFFCAAFADEIKKKYGAAKIITVNNLLANVDDLQGFARGIHDLLADDGVLVVESSYLGDMIKNMVFDFIYHEHLSYFSVKPLSAFFRRFDMELSDVEHVATKGGSLRYYFRKKGAPYAVSSAVGEILEIENKRGLDKPEAFKDFERKINDRKARLYQELSRIRKEGKSVIGYGASATTTTLLYHFNLAGFLDFIIDDNPPKKGTYSPGYHIPVYDPEMIYKKVPDYILVLAWRYAEPIIAKNKRFLERGGKFIIPLPEFRIVEKI